MNVERIDAPTWRLLVAVAVVIALVAAMALLFLRTARHNYAKHRAKFLSLFVGEAYAKEVKGDSVAGKSPTNVPTRLQPGAEAHTHTDAAGRVGLRELEHD